MDHSGAGCSRLFCKKKGVAKRNRFATPFLGTFVSFVHCFSSFLFFCPGVDVRDSTWGQNRKETDRNIDGTERIPWMMRSVPLAETAVAGKLIFWPQPFQLLEPDGCAGIAGHSPVPSGGKADAAYLDPVGHTVPLKLLAEKSAVKNIQPMEYRCLRIFVFKSTACHGINFRRGKAKPKHIV